MDKFVSAKDLLKNSNECYEELIAASISEPIAKKYSRSDNVVAFTKSDFDRILAASTEEQLKCDYCHGRAYLMLSVGGALSIVNNKLLDQPDEDLMPLYQTRKIKYCPMCGRN